MYLRRRAELPYDQGRRNVSSGDIFSLTLTLIILKTLYAASYVLHVFNPALRPRIVWSLIDRAERRIMNILTSLIAMDTYRPMPSTRTTEHSLSFPFMDGNMDRHFFQAPSDFLASAMESASRPSESTNDHRAAARMGESDNLSRSGFQNGERLSGPPVIPPPITLPPLRLRSSDGADEIESVSNMPVNLSHLSYNSVSDSVYSSTSKERQDGANQRTSPPSSVRASASSAALPYTQLIPKTPFFTSGSRRSSTRSAGPDNKSGVWSNSHSETTESLGTDLHYLGLTKTISSNPGIFQVNSGLPYTPLATVSQGKSQSIVDGPYTSVRPFSAQMYVLESPKHHDLPKQSHRSLRSGSGQSQYFDALMPHKPILQRQQDLNESAVGLRVPSMTEVTAV